MEIRTQKPFEKPDGGSYIGTIIDVAAKEVADTDFVTRLQKVGPDGKGLTKVQVTFTWTLGYVNGQAAVDSEGRAYQVFETYDAYQNPAKPSKLDKALAQILNAAPPLLSNTDQLEPLLLGRSNELFITKTPKVNNPNELTVKVIGHSPLKPGQIAPKTPAGFVRIKDRTKTQAGPNPGQSTQTYAQPPAQPQAQGFYQPPAAPPAQQAAPAPAVNLNNDAF
jgi:hypothetical protein